MPINQFRPQNLHIKIRRIENTFQIDADSDVNLLSAETSFPKSALDEIYRRSEPLLMGDAFPEAELIELGKIHFETIFDGPVRDVLRQMQARLSSWEYLRILLDLRDRALQKVPWELMWDPWRKQYLCYKGKTTIVRYVEHDEGGRTGDINVETALRILVAISSPEYTTKARLNKEKEEEFIRKALKSDRIKVDVRDGKLESIKFGLKEDPDILHFIGHGGIDRQIPVLVLEDAKGRDLLAGSKLLENELFPDLIHRKPRLRLITLSACQTADTPETEGYESLAHILAQRVGSVIAMKYPIKEDNAMAFFSRLYLNYAQQFPLDRCVVEARRAIQEGDPEEQRDWLSPVLVSGRAVLGIARAADPFKGPYNYESSDVNRFHGREEEIKELIRRVDAHPAVVVLGPPACGKTSMLMAGFTPEISRTSEPIRVTVDEDLEVRLREEISRLLIEQGESGIAEGDITTEIDRFPATLILIFDQVEQARYLGERVNTIIAAIINKANAQARNGGGFKVVLSTRPDLDGEIPGIIEDHVENLDSAVLELDMLDYDQMANVILRTTATTDIQFQPEAITRILMGVEYVEKKDMLAVQVVCKAVFLRARLDKETEVDPGFISDKFGSVDKILEANYAIAQKLKDTMYHGGELAKEVLALFVRADKKASRPRSYEEIQWLTSVKVGREQALDKLIDRLIEDNILKVEQIVGEKRFELVHDAFVAQILKLEPCPINERTQQQRRCEEILYRVGDGILDVGRKSVDGKEATGLACLAEARDACSLILMKDHQKTVFRSALEFESDQELDAWYREITVPEVILDIFKSDSLKEDVYLRGMKYLGKTARDFPHLKDPVLELLLDLISKKGGDILKAASAEAAPLLSQEAFRDHFQGGDRNTVRAAAIIYNQDGKTLGGFDPAQRRRVRWEAVRSNRDTILGRLFRGGGLGALGFALVALYNWYLYVILANIKLVKLEKTDILTLLPLGLMVFVLAFPGMGMVSLARDLARYALGGRRNRHAAWGVILGGGVGTGFTVLLLTILAKINAIEQFSWLPTMSAVVLGALIAGGWALRLLGARWRYASLLVSAGLGALTYYLTHEVLDWWQRGYLLLTPYWTRDAVIIGALLGIFIWLGLDRRWPDPNEQPGW
jgi:hypothetical protein